MEKFAEIINTDFQKILQSARDPNMHMFFDSFLQFWEPVVEKWGLEDNYKYVIDNIDPDETILSYDPKVDISKIQPLDQCSIEPTKIITDGKIC